MNLNFLVPQARPATTYFIVQRALLLTSRLINVKRESLKIVGAKGKKKDSYTLGAYKLHF